MSIHHCTSQYPFQSKKAELERSRDRLTDNEEIPIDEVVQVGYPLYNQLVKAYAEDATIDDTVYYLGEALRKGVIDCDTFLKSARNISRKQFYLRLTIQKCRAKASLP
jgi:ESCRT-I complex subunit TSG101